MKVRIKRIIHADYIADVPLPQYMTPGSAGMDIYSANKEDMVLSPNSVLAIPTGLAFEIPQGYELQIRPRSGLALNYSVSILNSPGTIDSDYRGEVKIIMFNLGKEDFVIPPKKRIAQAVLSPVMQAVLEEVDHLKDTSRKSGGFGSTGY